MQLKPQWKHRTFMISNDICLQLSTDLARTIGAEAHTMMICCLYEVDRTFSVWDIRIDNNNVLIITLSPTQKSRRHHKFNLQGKFQRFIIYPRLIHISRCSSVSFSSNVSSWGFIGGTDSVSMWWVALYPIAIVCSSRGAIVVFYILLHFGSKVKNNIGRVVVKVIFLVLKCLFKRVKK